MLYIRYVHGLDDRRMQGEENSIIILLTASHRHLTLDAVAEVIGHCLLHSPRRLECSAETGSAPAHLISLSSPRQDLDVSWALTE
jgi:hypothetical protein